MESVDIKSSNRIELRVIHAAATMLDAWMTVTNEGHAITYPVQTQLGYPIRAIVEDETVLLREGRLFIHDGGPASDKAVKPSYGLVQYIATSHVEAESVAQEQFRVRLYIPTDRYALMWDLAARARMPRLSSLQVKGLQADTEWNIAGAGPMLLVEDFSFSFPIST